MGRDPERIEKPAVPPKKRNNLQRVLIVLGIAANLAFLFINLRPQRPHLGKLRHAKVLLRADPWRAKWIEANELSAFGTEHDIQIDVVEALSFEDVLSTLKKEKEHPTGLLLATLDDTISTELIESGAVQPVDAVLSPKDLAALSDDFSKFAMSASKVKDKTWFLPRRIEIDVAAYLSTAVEDAYLHWDVDRAAIQAALVEANGVGLPKGYSLKKTPNAWDTYDLFVAAWYWAHHPAWWAIPVGSVAPRIAFRTGPGEEAVRDVLSAFYRHGLTEKELGSTTAAPVIDALQWEALFRKHHLVAPGCEDPKGIDSNGVNDLLKGRQIAWGPINQEDSLWLHGGSQRDAQPGLWSPRDLGWATMPQGLSLAQTNNMPTRVGRSFSFGKVQLWGVPAGSTDAKLAVELARFLTQRGLQQRETEAQGLLPVRKDLRTDYPIVFRLEWMQRLLDASYQQVARGAGQMPSRIGPEELDTKYAALRAKVVYGRPANAPGTYADIQAAVNEVSHGK